MARRMRSISSFDGSVRQCLITPKTDNSMRKAALSEGLLAEIEIWRMMAVETRDDAWVFPSERMTPLSKDNCWRRFVDPALAEAGQCWANFMETPRNHSSYQKH